MKNPSLPHLLWCALFGGAFFLASPASAPVGMGAVLAAQSSGNGGSSAVAEIDEIFREWDSTRSPGCAVGVRRDGETLLARAYGMSDLEHGIANTPETIFEAGSVSKQFTAAAVVLLVEEGALSFDDDVRDHLPELPDYGEPVRIHHLLNHTSGLRDWGSVAALSGWGRGARTHDHDHVLEIASRQSALNYPPGEAYSYTNTGYNLLAIIVERVSGTSFAEFSKARIFEPLGMTDTEWRDDYRRIVPGRSSAYTPAGQGRFRIDRPIEDVHGNGGLLTTVDDLLIWTEALEAGTFGGPMFGELMHRQGVLTNGREISYASGLQAGRYRGVRRVSHTGSTAGYRAYLGRYPDQGLSVALLCNVGNANPGSLGNQVTDVFLGDVPEPALAQRQAGIALAASVLEARAGLYAHETSGEPLRLRMQDGELRMGNAVLNALSEREFQVGSGERHLVFEGGSGTSGRSPFRAADAGYDDGRYLPMEEVTPDVAALREYEGTYHSDDAETTLVLRVEDGELVAHRRPSTTLTVAPLYPDAFQAQGLGLIRFHRDRAGRITELGIRQGRVHDIRFQVVERGSGAP